MNSVIKYIGIGIIFLLVFAGCRSTKDYLNADGKLQFRAAFYNVENLFDLEDNPDKIDEFFTPAGETNWNQERYTKKINDLARVIEAMEYPTIIGLCEVENQLVCTDFCEKTSLAQKGYGVVHHESPDARGIDVAFLYQKKGFKLISSDIIRINFPEGYLEEEEYTTRDVLHVQGIFNKNDKFHIFINHWPSRRGGLEASESKRTYVAKQVRAKIDELYTANPNANILVMGDFNDEPDNKSIQEVLGAKMDKSATGATDLYNLMSDLDKEGKGSYNYKGNWNMLDQLIVSSSLASGKNNIDFLDPVIFRAEWMIYKDKKYGDKPSRTYGGPNYYGGFSDHFPVYVDFVID